MKKTNNKGFSLVELIIVIAIMAVLVGVLAPAYTRYVENARKSRDVSAVDSVLTVVETSLIDYNARTNEVANVAITVPHSGAATNEISLTVTDATGAALSDLETEIEAVMGTYEMAGDWEVNSSDATADVINATVNNGSVTFTDSDESTAGNLIDAMLRYSDALGGRITNAVDAAAPTS